jgi:hypothetical protein
MSERAHGVPDHPPDQYAGTRRAERRERARSKARQGMQVSGASVKLLARTAAERARKAAAPPRRTSPSAGGPS